MSDEPTATAASGCTDEHAKFCSDCTTARLHNSIHCQDCGEGRPSAATTAATDEFVRVPDHVADRHGNVWRVVRDGGMVTRAEYDGVESCGITYAESVYGPLRPVYVNGGPDGLAVEPMEARNGT